MKIMKHLLTLALLVCLGTFAHAQIPSYVPTNGLVGWWPFNGNANDESGNGNHGTVNGATLAADRFGNAGKAYSFDGVDDYISTNNPLGNLSSDFSFCVYVNLSSWKSGQFVHIGIDQIAFPRDGFGYGLGGSHEFVSLLSNINWYNSGYQFTNLTTWLHACIIRRYNSLLYYVNGAYIGSNSIPSISPPSNTMFFASGAPQYENLNGLLDDIAIYNRALTAAEVQQLYLGNSSNTAAASTVPGKIHYQGLAVGANGKPIKNGTVGLRLSVLDSFPNGSALYTETKTASTDAAGIFSTYLGGGTATSGTFANIPWANGNDKFLKVEMDTQGGTNYQNMGSTQLVSVPYALHAGSANEANSLRDDLGNDYKVQIVNGQPTLVANIDNFNCNDSLFYGGKKYSTVLIGNQCWFKENLNFGKMINGGINQSNDEIIEKFCYDNFQNNCDNYGGLYQWAEALKYQNGANSNTWTVPGFVGNVQGICPTGWHIPKYNEFCSLTKFVDSTVICNSWGWSGSLYGGGKLKSTNTIFWSQGNIGATNSSGFSALPAGYINPLPNPYFIGKYSETYFLTVTEYSSSEIYVLGLSNSDSQIYFDFRNKNYGFSIRCLKD